MIILLHNLMIDLTQLRNGEKLPPNFVDPHPDANVSFQPSYEYCPKEKFNKFRQHFKKIVAVERTYVFG